MSRKKIWTIGLAACAVVLAAAVAVSLKDIWGGMGYGYASAEKYAAGGAEIKETVRSLDVDWIDGKVTIAYHSEPVIRLNETSRKSIPEDCEMRWLLDGDTLRVQYRKPGMLLMSKNLEKELTLTLPEDAEFDNVRIAATSGELIIPSLRADTIDLQTTSGDVFASVSASSVKRGATSGDTDLTVSGNAREIDCGATSGQIVLTAENAETLKAGTTSGGIQVTAGNVGTFRADATSGGVSAEIGQAGDAKIGTTSGRVTVKLEGLGSLDVSATSGDVTAYLPSEPGFTASVSTTSGGFEYGISLAKNGSSYVCGDGSGRVAIGTTSGDVRIEPVE